MKLRKSIRPPERYESKNFYSPMSQRPLRPLKPQDAPALIEFNPNLPPAAFPTLNHPHPEIPRTTGVGEEQGSVATSPCQPSGQPDRHGHHGGCMVTNEARVGIEDIPVNQIENHMASNGNMNPVYVQNMAAMAAVGTSSVDIDMDNSDTDDVEHRHEPKYSIRDPKWKDLPPGMQAEIFDNLLQRYTWSTASHLLGLSVQEQDELEEHLSARDNQTKREDLQLVDMRKRQLSALLRIDNSSMHKRDSARFVFRKISRDSTRSLGENTKPDYLACDATDVANARRYLHQHGLDPRYAGEWSNRIITDRLSRGDQGPDRSILKEHLAFGLCTDSATSVRPKDDHTMSLTVDDGTNSTLNKQSFINMVGTASTPSAIELALCRGNLCAAPRWLNQLYQHNIPNYRPAFQENRIVRLRIGAEKAAHVRDAQLTATIQPSRLVRCFPPLDAIYWGPPRPRPPPLRVGVSGNTEVGFNPVMPQMTRPIPNGVSQPLQRTIGGKWSYPTTSSTRLQRRLEASRLETPGSGTQDTQSATSSRDDSQFSPPRQSPENMS